MVIYTEGFDHASTDAGYTLIEVTSTEEETKKVKKIVNSCLTTNAVLIGVSLEREDIAKDVPWETMICRPPHREINLDIDIPVGQTLKVIAKPQVAGSQGTVVGWIEYEITG